MKYLFLAIVFVSILVLAGCQDSQTTNPIQENTLKKTDDPSVHTGTIKLRALLQDPLPIGNSYYRIRGDIQYKHILQSRYHTPNNPQFSVSLELVTNSEFLYICTVCPPTTADETAGFISEVSQEIVPMPDNDRGVMLEKTYSIIGREDGMVLKCRFIVSTTNIGLIGMWLELINGDQSKNELNKNLIAEPVSYPNIVVD